MRRTISTWPTSTVAPSFASRNPEDGGLPQVGRYVDQVTETRLVTTQHADERYATAHPSRATRKYPQHRRSAEAPDSRRLSTRSSLRQRNHDCAHERCNSPLERGQSSHDWNVALTKMATTVHHQSAGVQQMGDWCGCSKHVPTNHTNTQTPEAGTQAAGRKDAFGEHLLFSAFAEHLQKRVNRNRCGARCDRRASTVPTMFCATASTAFAVVVKDQTELNQSTTVLRLSTHVSSSSSTRTTSLRL